MSAGAGAGASSDRGEDRAGAARRNRNTRLVIAGGNRGNMTGRLARAMVRGFVGYQTRIGVVEVNV